MKYSKRILCTFMILGSIFCQSIYASEDEISDKHDTVPINLYINGEYTETKVTPPVIIEGNTLVPAREVFEKMGAQVMWSANEKKVYIDKEDILMVIEMNNPDIYINGEIKTSTVPGAVINNKVMIPLRFISEELGYEVTWVGETKTINIAENKPPVVEPSEPPVVEPSEPPVVEPSEPPVVEPSEPPIVDPSAPIQISNMTYYPETNMLGFSKLDGIEASSLYVEEDYLNRRLVISLDNNYSHIYEEGIWAVMDDCVQKIEVNHLDRTQIIVTTSTVYASMVQDDVSDIMVQCVKPNEKYGKIVIIDPGHGDTDPGTSYEGIKEKDIVIDVGLKARDILTNYPDIKVYMVREGETYLDPYERADLANEIGADLFISIHVNSAKISTARGIETYYTSKEDTRNKIFADMVQAKLMETFDTKNRGVKDNVFIVNKYVESPSILIEIGFLTNLEDRAMMLAPGASQKYAEVICNTILEYYSRGLHDIR